MATLPPSLTQNKAEDSGPKHPRSIAEAAAAVPRPLFHPNEPKTQVSTLRKAPALPVIGIVVVLEVLAGHLRSRPVQTLLGARNRRGELSHQASF